MSEPTIITKESIMNFAIEQTVSYGHRLAKVVRIDGNKIRVQFDGTGFCDWIDYSFLRILPTIKKVNPHKYIKWSDLEIQILKDNAHFTNKQLAKIIDRSEGSINQARFKLKLPKRTMADMFRRAGR